MSEHEVYVPAAGAPPAGKSAETIAAELGWEVEYLLQLVRLGCVPQPDYYRETPIFAHDYVVIVRNCGMCLPGTWRVWCLPRRRGVRQSVAQRRDAHRVRSQIRREIDELRRVIAWKGGAR